MPRDSFRTLVRHQPKTCEPSSSFLFLVSCFLKVWHRLLAGVLFDSRAPLGACGKSRFYPLWRGQERGFLDFHHGLLESDPIAPPFWLAVLPLMRFPCTSAPGV